MKTKNRRQGMDKKISAKEEMTKKIIDYILSHQNGELSLDVIAQELNYSKFYMGRAFAETMGITVHKYIKEHRLAAAAMQLEMTDRPIIEIALDAGYGSHQAFTQAFGKRYQCSPQDYRKDSICRKNQISLKRKVYWKSFLYRKNYLFTFSQLIYDNQKGRRAA